jgi:predicted permease
MRSLTWLWRRVRAVWKSDEIDREIAEEMQLHIELRTEENVRRGMAPDVARRAAERRFGRLAEMREAGYDVRGGRGLEELWRDARFAVRMFAKNPAFTAAAVASLALGIGASAAIFSVVDGVLLRPLPYPEPDRIVALREISARGTMMPVCEPNFEDARARVRGLEALAAYSDFVVAVGGGSEPARARVCAVTGDFFRVVATQPSVGRAFTPEETSRGGPTAAVVSYGFWQRLLGAREDLSGTVLRFPEGTAAVVGVMPKGFAFPADAEVWVAAESAWPPNLSRTAHNWSVVGRLQPGVTLEAARADASAVAAQLRRENGDAMEAVDFALVPLQEYLTGSVRTGLLVLLGAVGLLMLIACANVANMLLARATARRREFALRAALGASRWRLARQSLTECVLLALAAAGVGVAVAYAMLGALLGLSRQYLPRAAAVGVDARSLVYTCALALAVGAVLGLVPALGGEARRPGLGDRGATADAASSRVGSLLVVSQVALTLLLAVGAGLLARSFFTLLAVDPGFRPESAVAMTVTPPERPDGGRAAEAARFEAPLVERLGRIPGVTAAGCATSLPMTGEGANGTFHVEGSAETGDAEYRRVTGGYFAAMGIPLLRGRTFGPGDTADAPHVALVSRALAEKYWPNEDPVGKRILFGNMDGDERPLEVVGVVGDVRDRGLDRDVRGTVYASALQRPRSWSLTFVARAEADPAALAPAMRAALAEVDPNVPATFRTVDEVFASSLESRRFSLLLFAVFAGVALALAVTGIYGVTSYSVAQRTQEIGVRMALGAGRADVLGLVVGRGARLALVGVAIGLAGAVGLGRFLASLLYGVSATDPLTLAGVAALVVAAALLACLPPARRATKVDPIVALKYE